MKYVINLITFCCWVFKSSSFILQWKTISWLFLQIEICLSESHCISINLLCIFQAVNINHCVNWGENNVFRKSSTVDEFEVNLTRSDLTYTVNVLLIILHCNFTLNFTLPFFCSRLQILSCSTKISCNSKVLNTVNAIIYVITKCSALFTLRQISLWFLPTFRMGAQYLGRDLRKITGSSFSISG